jgi:hypothetical protein
MTSAMAFDSINREMMWKILAKCGVPLPLVNVIVKMYTNIEISMSVGKAKATFPSTSGVKQDDILDPVLYIFAIQAARVPQTRLVSLIKEVHTRHSQERSTPSGFQQVLPCR